MMAAVAFLMLCGVGDVPSLAEAVAATLRDEGATAVECQAAVVALLHQPGSGKAAAPRPDEQALLVESAQPGTVPLPKAGGPPPRAAIRAYGTGAAKVHVPGERGRRIELYRHAGGSLYVRVDEGAVDAAGVARLDVPGPGAYVARDVDAWSMPAIAALEPREAKQRLSAAPEAKAEWRLVPEAPDTISGPTPVILIHGSGTNRWADFIAWARDSDQAAGFRERFQVWNYIHETAGVNAPIGFDAGRAAFDESMVAYLARFIAAARMEGVVADGARRYFPEGPFALYGHSQGGLVARAFMAHYPSYAEQVFAVVSIGAPHTGTPWATPEWVRHTVTRLGFSAPGDLDLMLEWGIAELGINQYNSNERQSDLDMGWGNFDAAGGFGIPTADFDAWKPWLGRLTLTLSPRDANQTEARLLPGYADATFEPAVRLATYCGGLETVQPMRRGELGLDRFYLYGSYVDLGSDWPDLLDEAGRVLGDRRAFENLALRGFQALMGLVASAGADAPAGAYLLGDGFVPLQSQLLLGGAETERLYATRTLLGATRPVYPLVVREDIIAGHTLGLPDRVRILPGWTHADTVTGRYDAATGESPLFEAVAADLMADS